eukprot:1375302-Prymnesium_polylepis.1
MATWTHVLSHRAGGDAGDGGGDPQAQLQPYVASCIMWVTNVGGRGGGAAPRACRARTRVSRSEPISCRRILPLHRLSVSPSSTTGSGR